MNFRLFFCLAFLTAVAPAPTFSQEPQPGAKTAATETQAQTDPVVGRWRFKDGTKFWELYPNGDAKLFESNGEAPRRVGKWNRVSVLDASVKYEIKWSIGTTDRAHLLKSPEKLVIDSINGMSAERVDRPQASLTPPSGDPDPIVGKWQFPDGPNGREIWTMSQDGSAKHNWGKALGAWQRGVWKLEQGALNPRRYEIKWGGETRGVGVNLTTNPDKLFIHGTKAGTMIGKKISGDGN